MVAILACLGALISVVTTPSRTNALNGSQFNPEKIISDELFYDASAMSASAIQSFLQGKIGACQTSRCLNVAVVPVPSRPAEYSTKTGRLICSDITGGNIAVSELIYRVQVACGISAKVILVTLQKEQGLVTSKAPSDWSLRAAMGMGCSDSSPCDDAFSGLANQIISGTRQLKVYKAGAFNRQPGPNFIQYSPNASCGGTQLNIENYATAALYNYTPYQPNEAALANLDKIGDGCSSYGNRNFWVFYNNWFGSTIAPPCTIAPSQDIERYWQDQGESSGPLGAPVSPGVVVGSGGLTVGYFANGEVYCTTNVGAFAVLGTIRTKYNEIGNVISRLGPPIGSVSDFSASGLTGRLQYFQKGLMLSYSTGTFAVLDGKIRNAWGIRGGSSGSLGWPAGDQLDVNGGAAQRFQNGLLVVPAAGSAWVLSGEIASYWAAGSNGSRLGYPVGSPVSLTAGGVSGSYQVFERGMVLSSASTGTFAVLDGRIRNAWGSAGGTGGSLGWPTGDQESTSSGVKQQFQHGLVLVSSSGGAGVLSGEIASYWAAGSNGSRLGYPVGSPVSLTAGGVSGSYQVFERGMVLSSASTGTFAVLDGPIRNAWGSAGGTGGSLGWPTGDQESTSSGVSQIFQKGYLEVKNEGTVTKVIGAVFQFWAAASNRTLLGLPKGNSIQWSANSVTGAYQVFDNGMVMSSTPTGTHAVLDGPFRNVWGAAGGSGGSLGWPVGDEVTTPDGHSQEFQFGTIFVPTAGDPYIVPKTK